MIAMMHDMLANLSALLLFRLHKSMRGAAGSSREQQGAYHREAASTPGRRPADAQKWQHLLHSHSTIERAGPEEHVDQQHSPENSVMVWHDVLPRLSQMQCIFCRNVSDITSIYRGRSPADLHTDIAS